MKKSDAIFYIKRFLISMILIIVFITTLSVLLIDKNDFKVIDKLKNITFNPKNPKVRIYRTKTKKIEEMKLEEYVKGVLSAEMPVEFHIEALKAQAVAARTYALSHVKGYGGKSCSNGKGADLCDTTHCQVYMDKKDRISRWPKNKAKEYWKKIEQAVKNTEGEVIKYEDKVITDPYYFSTSSGNTEACEEVFSQEKPYLKSVKSEGDKISPKYKTSVKYSYKNLFNIINKKYPKSISNIKSLKDSIKIKSKTKGGSVRELQLGKTTIKGVKFRSLLGLNSANFTFKFNKNEIEIICLGYGHGVGMSQWGANALGKSGKKYKDILIHYYKGVNVGHF